MESTVNSSGSNDYTLAHLGKDRLCEKGKISVYLMYYQDAIYHAQNILSANTS